MLGEPLVEGKGVVVQKSATGEVALGCIYGVDESGRLIIRTVDRDQKEYVSNPDLVERGFATNPKGHIRFYALPMSEEAKELFKNGVNKASVA